MHYILDTGFFIIVRGYYPKTFPAFWEKMKEAVNSNLISSVSQVKDEIQNYGGSQRHLLQWIDKNKAIFTDPAKEEQQNIKKIFTIKEFQTLVSRKIMLKGGLLADPFLIAKAIDHIEKYGSY